MGGTKVNLVQKWQIVGYSGLRGLKRCTSP